MTATLMAFHVLCELQQLRIRAQLQQVPKRREHPHGTNAKYLRDKCRCFDCRVAHNVVNQPYRAKDPRRQDAAWRKAQKGSGHAA